MNNSNEACLNPEFLTGTPEECSPEQIRKCHGELHGHPCGDAESSKPEKHGPNIEEDEKHGNTGSFRRG